MSASTSTASPGEAVRPNARAVSWTALDLAEGFQLAHAVAALIDLGVLDALARPSTAAALARPRGLDPVMLGRALAYLAARTELVERRGTKFVARTTPGARYLIDLYTGGFGRNAVQLAQLLRHPTRAAATVDRRRHARAFAAMAGQGLGAMPGLVRQLGGAPVLDLGCGTGSLLVELARQDPAFTGYGLERNPAMVRAARAQVRAAKLGRRIQILAGDLTTRALPTEIHTVTMCDVANELFATGPAAFIAWLRTARRRLPGRLLIVADYYGRLDGPGLPVAGSTAEWPCGVLDTPNAPLHRETLLQDYAQSISGQGVPPPDVAAWQAIYRRAGCRLVHAIEDTSTTRFIHVARLGAPG